MVQQGQRTPRLPPEVRRNELLDAALDAVTEDGFDALTVEAVTRRAGVTRPVVYDLFGDLDGLMAALLDREEEAALAPLLAIVGGDPGDDVDPEAFLHQSVLGFLRAVKANPRTWRLVLMPPRGRSANLRARIAATRTLIAGRVAALLAWGLQRRGGPGGLDLELFGRLIVAAGEDAARLTLLHPHRYPPERLAGMTVDGIAVLPADARPQGVPSPVAIDAVAPPQKPDGPRPVPLRMPREQRREHLLDVALELIAEQGFDALSMEAIARHAGVNRVVVYRNYGNLQLLLLALLRREDARTRAMLEALLPADPGERTAAELLQLTLADFLAEVMRHPRTYRVILQRPESAPLFLQKMVNRRRGDLAERLRPLVEWGIAGLEAPTDDLDSDLLSRLLLSSGEELARLALDDPSFPPQRILESAWALLDLLPLR